MNYYIDEGEFFRSTTGLELFATDNGDGTFTVAVPTSGDSFPFTITQNAITPGTFDFEWASQPGKVYDLLTSTDLADPVAEWPVYDEGGTDYESLPAVGETTTLIAVPSVDPRSAPQCYLIPAEISHQKCGNFSAGCFPKRYRYPAM